MPPCLLSEWSLQGASCLTCSWSSAAISERNGFGSPHQRSHLFVAVFRDNWKRIPLRGRNERCVSRALNRTRHDLTLFLLARLDGRTTYQDYSMSGVVSIRASWRLRLNPRLSCIRPPGRIAGGLPATTWNADRHRSPSVPGASRGTVLSPPVRLQPRNTGPLPTSLL